MDSLSGRAVCLKNGWRLSCDRFEPCLYVFSATLFILVGLALAVGDPQERAGAGMALALCVVIGGGTVSLLVVFRRVTAPIRCWQLIFDQANGDWEGGLVPAQVTAKYAQLLGYSEGELRGLTVDVYLPHGLRKGHAESLNRAGQAGRHRYVVLLRHREGHLFPCVISFSVFPGAHGGMDRRLDDILDLDEVEDTQNRLDIAWKIFDATPVGMVMADPDGRYTRVNRAMCDFTGYSESELLGRNYSEITHPDDDSQKEWLGKAAVDPGSPACLIEKRYLRKDGEALWALLVALPAFGSDGNLLYWVGQVLDIDRIKRVEQALRVTEERFRGIFENANTGMAVVDKAGRIECFNDAFQCLLGFDDDVLRQMHFDDFGLAEDRVGATAFFDEILRGRGDKYRIEKRWLACNDRIIWVDLCISATRNERGEVMSFIAVVGDITERKKSALALADSKRKLRALASYQEGLLELERKHIAREVHDEMGQLLTALKMDISLMRLRFGQDPGLLEMIDGMRSLVERAINVVRQVASNLRPAVLDHGLVPAIEWLAEDFSKRSAIACRLTGGDFAIDLPEPQSTAVFRVVQESLTNVARHALAREVVISVRRSGRQLQVVVTDDGHGFDTVVVGKARGFGLFGMRERILGLGGTLRIKSAPGQGTAVSIRLPLASGETS